jgi:gas vesicle protein
MHVKKQRQAKQPDRGKSSIRQTMGFVGTTIGAVVCSGAMLLAPIPTNAETQIPQNPPADSLKVKNNAQGGTVQGMQQAIIEVQSDKTRNVKTPLGSTQNPAAKVKGGAKGGQNKQIDAGEEPQNKQTIK